MALTGNNGDNETNIGSSKSIDYSLYDESVNEIQVENVKAPIDIWISRDTSVSIEPYSFMNTMNATSITNVSSSLVYNQSSGMVINGLMVSGFNLNGANVSLHVQIRPLQKQRGYLSLIKFGRNPTVNDYDFLNKFCTKDLITDEYYLIFLNMTQVNGFKGYVGLSIGEIDFSLFNSTSNIELISQNFTFTSNYWQRVYSSGCYYMNTKTNEWSSLGMEILADSNLTHTHCQSTHLTTFASGLNVLSNANDVFENDSFLQNTIIFSTLFASICLIKSSK